MANTTLTLSITAIALLLSTTLLLTACLRNFEQKSFTRCYSQLCCGVFAGLLGLILLLTVFSLQSYQRLSHEEDVAEIAIEKLNHEKYLLRLLINGQMMQTVTLEGEQWQLDARIVKWHNWANLLGLHTLYRLERLSARRQTANQQHNVTSVHLTDTTNFDSALRWLPMVDSIYGNSTYMPMGHGARYRVTLSTSGLVTRAANDHAVALLANWN